MRSSNLIPYCHISLPFITNFVINANHERSQPTPSHCAMCQYVECHLLILFLIRLLNVGACICHIAWEGQVEWTTTNHTIKMLHFLLFHSVTCYTNSIVSCIPVNTTKLRDVTCTLVATCVILRSLECNFKKGINITLHNSWVVCPHDYVSHKHDFLSSPELPVHGENSGRVL